MFFFCQYLFLHSFAFVIHCLWSLHKIWGGLGAPFMHKPSSHTLVLCWPGYALFRAPFMHFLLDKHTWFIFTSRAIVLLPSKITLLSNIVSVSKFANKVLLPSKITLLSNEVYQHRQGLTVLLPSKITLLSNRTCCRSHRPHVLLPSKITLLSNYCTLFLPCSSVLLPSKITLLSNGFLGSDIVPSVLLPSKITLLSNLFQKYPFAR